MITLLQKPEKMFSACQSLELVTLDQQRAHDRQSDNRGQLQMTAPDLLTD